MSTTPMINETYFETESFPYFVQKLLGCSIHLDEFFKNVQNRVKGGGRAPIPHQPGLIFRSWWTVRQTAAIATLCVLCGLTWRHRWRSDGWSGWTLPLRSPPVITTWEVLSPVLSLFFVFFHVLWPILYLKSVGAGIFSLYSAYPHQLILKLKTSLLAQLLITQTSFYQVSTKPMQRLKYGQEKTANFWRFFVSLCLDEIKVKG